VVRVRLTGKLIPLHWGVRFLSHVSNFPGIQEVLSKTDEPNAPLNGRENCELSMLDEENDLGTRYCDRQAHAEWSDIDGQIMSGQEETDHFRILNAAKHRYAERRLALTEKGFVYSEMDLL